MSQAPNAADFQKLLANFLRQVFLVIPLYQDKAPAVPWEQYQYAGHIRDIKLGGQRVTTAHPMV